MPKQSKPKEIDPEIELLTHVGIYFGFNKAWMAYSQKDLKKFCQNKDLKVGGNKPIVSKRLHKYYSDLKNAADAAVAKIQQQQTQADAQQDQGHQQQIEEEDVQQQIEEEDDQQQIEEQGDQQKQASSPPSIPTSPPTNEKKEEEQTQEEVEQEEVADPLLTFLSSAGLGVHYASFLQHGINVFDLDILGAMTDAYLEVIGITQIGEKLKYFGAVKKHSRPKQECKNDVKVMTTKNKIVKNVDMEKRYWTVILNRILYYKINKQIIGKGAEIRSPVLIQGMANVTKNAKWVEYGVKMGAGGTDEVKWAIERLGLQSDLGLKLVVRRETPKDESNMQTTNHSKMKKKGGFKMSGGNFSKEIFYVERLNPLGEFKKMAKTQQDDFKVNLKTNNIDINNIMTKWGEFDEACEAGLCEL
eukprot:50822_1